MQTELKCHPACLLLPEMPDAEYRELVEDIRKNGLRKGVTLCAHNAILDGRHRYRALCELGIWDPQRHVARYSSAEPTEEELIALVMSENIHRRHLSTQQRAAIAAELANMKPGTRTDLRSNDPRSEEPIISNAKAAQMVGVSEPSVKRAKKRMREEPEAHQLAKEGKLKKAKAGNKARSEPQPKTKNRQGYTIGGKSCNGPCLLEALGRLIAFTPETAVRYVVNHPDKASKIRGLVGPAKRVIEALQEVSSDKQDTPAEDYPIPTIRQIAVAAGDHLETA
jgi:ParB-like chromosome segregation protein Spo0J